MTSIDVLPPTKAPEGLRLIHDVVTLDEEHQFIDCVESMDGSWEHARLRRHLPAARREMRCFGWDYLTDGRGLRRGAAMPSIVADIRDRCAWAAGHEPAAFEQAIVTRYAPNAGINWHVDAPAFGPVVLTLSLATDWRMDLRPKGGESVPVPLPRRSLLVLTGPARSAWWHRIPPVRALRYSLSLRSLAGVPRP